jgi:two-component system chemotaxis response regulator CheY
LAIEVYMPRLLLVDDNPSIHKIVASLLDSTAIVVSHAADAEEALKIVEGGAKIDVALLDTTLPGTNGWELLGRLRSDPRTASLPIALMAGVLEDVGLARVEREPIQAFLRKPVDLRDLADKVRALIAIPYRPPVSAQQPAESAPSDLLILEKQDLAQDISLADSSEELVQETTLADPGEAAGYAVADEAEAPPEDDTISIELEDLDLAKIDQLVVESGGAEESPKSDPDNFLDTAPGDFGLELGPPGGQGGRRSPVANELLSDREFIRAVAKEVEKNIALRGADA